MKRFHRGHGGPTMCQVLQGYKVHTVLMFKTDRVLKAIKAGTLNVFYHRNTATQVPGQSMKEFQDNGMGRQKALPASGMHKCGVYTKHILAAIKGLVMEIGIEGKKSTNPPLHNNVNVLNT